MRLILDISKEEIKKQSEKIFKPVRYGESGVAMCFPGCKIGYNLTRFVNNKDILKATLGGYYKRMAFMTISLEAGDDEKSFLQKVKESVKRFKLQVNPDDNLKHICEKMLRKGKDPFFFVLNGQVLDYDVLSKILRLIHETIVEMNKVGGLIFFEANIYKKELSELFESYDRFLQNVMLFPLYSLQESKIFIKNAAKNWHLKVNENLVNQIVKTCGGHLWILKFVLRIFRESGENNLEKILENPGVSIRINSILNLLTLDEKKDLIELCFGNKNKAKESNKNYFELVGLVEKDKKNYRIGIPLLESKLKDSFFSSQIRLSEDNKIEYQGKDISYLFSQQEKKALLLLIFNKGRIVSREQIASKLWKDEWAEKYSDWAIDKLISRIRLTLLKTGLSKNILVTKKGQGFLIY